MSSATSASVGPSPSSGAKTAAVAVERPVHPLGDVVRRRTPGAGVDPDRRCHVARARRRSGSAWSERSARSCLDLPCRFAMWLVGRRPGSRMVAPVATTSRAIVPADRECEPGAAVCGQRARDEAAEGRPAHEGEEVEARRPPAQVLRCGEVQRREGARAPEHVADAREEEQDADREQRVLRGEDELSTPKPRAPPSTSASACLADVARISAPQSAPQPKTDAISPKVRAPWSSVSFATSGSSTSKLNENVPTRSTVKNVTATRRELTAKRSASPTPARMPGSGLRHGRARREPDREQARSRSRSSAR